MDPATANDYPTGSDPIITPLHELLVSRGWCRDEEAFMPLWVYSPAFGGAMAAPDDEQLAELGPYAPMLCLAKPRIIVLGCGNWQGCAEHMQFAHEFCIRDADMPRALGGTLAAVEQDSVVADAEAYVECLTGGPCGDSFRAWKRGRGPWNGERLATTVHRARLSGQREPRTNEAP